MSRDGFALLIKSNVFCFVFFIVFLVILFFTTKNTMKNTRNTREVIFNKKLMTSKAFE